MPFPVRLDFVPPSTENITKLHVEEATALDQSFAEIDMTTEVGTFPNYISYYVTQAASATDNWFRIRWETSDGIFTPFSEPLQGGTKTLVQEIVDRVLLRNPTLNEIIVTQEAQAVVSETFSTEDPNSILVGEATPVQIRGMTNMTLARSLIATTLASGGTVAKFTAGLVSLQSGSTSQDPTKSIEALLKSAGEDLGQSSVGYVMLLADLTDRYCGISQNLHGVDLTRTTLTIYDYESESTV